MEEKYNNKKIKLTVNQAMKKEEKKTRDLLEQLISINFTNFNSFFIQNLTNKCELSKNINCKTISSKNLNVTLLLALFLF